MLGVQERLSTGLLTTNAQGTSTQAQATATVNDLAFAIALNSIVPSTLLNLNATTIQSFSQANSVGGLDASGSTLIEGFSLTGSALGGLSFSGSALLAPAANTTLFNAGGLSIILNEQTSFGDGINNIGINTNAIAIRFTDFAVGTGLKNGSVIIGNSRAFASLGAVNGAVPEPATWAMMLFGFGAVGHSMRSRKVSYRKLEAV